ncbi:histidine kinase, partial [Pantoea rodasii]
ADLYTVLRNLVHNAIQYTPSGGCIDVAIERLANRVLITVEDSGPGIPTDKHQRVFDAFYRIEGSDASGSGLGLSIVSVMLMRMQGEVTLSAATRFSSGLQVRVCLPTV